MEHEEESAPKRRTRQELLLGETGGSGGAGRPTILDPEDGLPRPDDQIVGELQGIASETDENFVCTEGGPWLGWSEEHGGAFREVEGELDEDKLVLHGFTRAGRDGYPMEDRVYRHVDTGALYRRARMVCCHYLEQISPDTSMIREDGAGVAQTILRQCKLFDLALSDEAVLSCNVRGPRDIVSERVLVQRAREKKRLAELSPTPVFRSMTAAENKAQDTSEDPLLATVKEGLHTIEDARRLKAVGQVFFLSPSAPPADVLRCQPLIVFYPDRAWQPPDSVIYGKMFVDDEGETRPWGSTSLKGEQITRFLRKETDDPSTYTRFAAFSWMGNVRAIAKACLDGRNVSIVAYHDSTRVQLSAAVTQAARIFIQEIIHDLAIATKDTPPLNLSRTIQPHVIPYVDSYRAKLLRDKDNVAATIAPSPLASPTTSKKP